MTRMLEIRRKRIPCTFAGGVSNSRWLSGARFDLDADRFRWADVRRLRRDPSCHFYD